MPCSAQPVVRPSAATKKFTLRCFVYPERSTGMFVAECVDLDLIVKARKANKASRELRDAIIGYVRVAVESGQDADLIPRPSPLVHRMHYYLVVLASRLSLLSRDRLFDFTPAPTRCFA